MVPRKLHLYQEVRIGDPQKQPVLQNSITICPQHQKEKNTRRAQHEIQRGQGESGKELSAMNMATLAMRLITAKAGWLDFVNGNETWRLWWCHVWSKLRNYEESNLAYFIINSSQALGFWRREFTIGRYSSGSSPNFANISATSAASACPFHTLHSYIHSTTTTIWSDNKKLKKGFHRIIKEIWGEVYIEINGRPVSGTAMISSCSLLSSLM